MLSISELKKGVVLKINNKPFIITARDHSHMGRGGNILRVKLKNLIDGATMEHTFRGADTAEEADIVKVNAQYLYKDQTNGYFMHQETYEEISMPLDLIKDEILYLMEGQTVQVLIFDQRPAAIELPKALDLKIAFTSSGTRGNTAQGSVRKEATLETGLVINVPLFIKDGDMVRVNTETGEYTDRVVQ